jgi:acyl-CoA synthetase (AMP-forming)/AMP-acid ligase II
MNSMGAPNRLAHELLARRGSVAEPVALYLGERSDVVVAYMAVLKAGKFSVVLDPLVDVNRSTHIVKDCGARVMIVDQTRTAPAQNWFPMNVRSSA